MKPKEDGVADGELSAATDKKVHTNDYSEEIGFSHIGRAVASVLARTLKTMFDSTED